MVKRLDEQKKNQVETHDADDDGKQSNDIT
jgi:hypothetical protein